MADDAGLQDARFRLHSFSHAMSMSTAANGAQAFAFDPFQPRTLGDPGLHPDELLDPTAFETDRRSDGQTVSEPAAHALSPSPPVSPQHAQWPFDMNGHHLVTAAPISAPPGGHFGVHPPIPQHQFISPPRIRRTTSTAPIDYAFPPDRMPRRAVTPSRFQSPDRPSSRFSPIGPIGGSPRAAGLGLGRAPTNPGSPSGSKRRVTGKRGKEPPAAPTEAVLPRRTASSRVARPYAPPTAASMPISLTEAYAALDTVRTFIAERAACEAVGCRNCMAGGAIAEPEHSRAIEQLTERVTSRIAALDSQRNANISVPQPGQQQHGSAL